MTLPCIACGRLLDVSDMQVHLQHLKSAWVQMAVDAARDNITVFPGNGCLLPSTIVFVSTKCLLASTILS